MQFIQLTSTRAMFGYILVIPSTIGHNPARHVRIDEGVGTLFPPVEMGICLTPSQ